MEELKGEEVPGTGRLRNPNPVELTMSPAPFYRWRSGHQVRK